MVKFAGAMEHDPNSNQLQAVNQVAVSAHMFWLHFWCTSWKQKLDIEYNLLLYCSLIGHFRYMNTVNTSVSIYQAYFQTLPKEICNADQ